MPCRIIAELAIRSLWIDTERYIAAHVKLVCILGPGFFRTFLEIKNADQL